MNHSHDLQDSAILVVDDQPDNLRVVSEYLEHYDVDVMLAHNGADALEKARRGRPDLVLLDVMMPDMDGFEVCRRLKGEAAFQDLPVIFLSALREVEDKVKGFEAGGVDFLTKPIDEAELLARVRTHLALRAAHKNLAEKNRQLEAEKQALEQAKQAAEAASRAKSTFLANISHEIRTPMNAILGFTEVLHSQIQNTEQREYLHAIQSSSKTLLGLINDILDLSKVEAGKLKLEYTATDSRPLFEEMVQMFLPKTQAKGLDFRVDIAADLPPRLMVDEIRVRQILINLIGNAVKFTDHGFIELSVSHAPCQEDPNAISLTFAVRDSGIGISQDQQADMFQPFEQQQGQSHSRYGGTGLGLAICKQLAELMDGSIALASTPGQGSAFTVRLKRVAVAAHTAPVAPAVDSLENIRFAPATVLIADDQPFNRKLLSVHLQKFGFTLLEAENGEEAVLIAASALPDLVLLDMKMPVLDGPEAARQLKNNPKTRHIPVIAVTAGALSEDVAIFSALCEGYLDKPIQKAALIRTLQSVFGQEAG